MASFLLMCALRLSCFEASLAAQTLPGIVLHTAKLGNGAEGLPPIEQYAAFGTAVACLGDLDKDGVDDFAVGRGGSTFSPPAPIAAQKVAVLFMNPDGSVKRSASIAEGEGGFTGTLESHHGFGRSLASLGDVDRDGVPDLAIGAFGDKSVWVLLLTPHGTVKSAGKFSVDVPYFGYAVTAAGDRDKDGVPDLFVGAPGFGTETVFLVHLDADGSMKSYSALETPPISEYFTEYGSAISLAGDVDRDGVSDLAVGEPGCEICSEPGSVWVFFLNTDGSVREFAQILGSDLGLEGSTRFGASLASLGDGYLAVGVPGAVHPILTEMPGWVYILFLREDGSLASYHVIGEGQGGFAGDLNAPDMFGCALAAHSAGLAVGARLDDDGAFQSGAVWLLSLQSGEGTPWLNLGFGLGSSFLVPEGTLVGNEMVSAGLSGAVAGVPVWLLVGADGAYVPWKGGVAVPAPHYTLPLFTDAFGNFSLSGRMPIGTLAGTELYVQAWYPDVSAPEGWAASNAILGTVP